MSISGFLLSDIGTSVIFPCKNTGAYSELPTNNGSITPSLSMLVSRYAEEFRVLF